MDYYEEVELFNQKYIIIANSQMGENKLENQDSYAIYHDDESIICCLADGLGSVPFSKEGSKKIVDLGISLLKQDIDDDLFLKLREEWKKSVKSNYELYDTTFKYFKITKNKIYLGSIGDGWLAGINAGEYINETVAHEFANHTDTILTNELDSKKLQRELNNDMNIMLLSTDGFSEDIDKTNDDFILDVSVSIVKDGKEFLKDLVELMANWPIKSNKDDKSIVVVKKL